MNASLNNVYFETAWNNIHHYSSIQDVAKPSLRKDWNCPWVKRDGKGLKRVVRNIYGEDPAPAPAATSHHHFYRQRHYYNPNCNILTLSWLWMINFLIVFYSSNWYSDPHSILAPEAPPIPTEELEKMIRERMGEQDRPGVGASQQQQRYSSNFAYPMQYILHFFSAFCEN